jgi:hypothetical protein
MACEGVIEIKRLNLAGIFSPCAFLCCFLGGLFLLLPPSSSRGPQGFCRGFQGFCWVCPGSCWVCPGSCWVCPGSCWWRPRVACRAVPHPPLLISRPALYKLYYTVLFLEASLAFYQSHSLALFCPGSCYSNTQFNLIQRKQGFQRV